MDTHKNVRLTPKGREEMVRAVTSFRPHGSLKANTLVSRLALPEDNVPRLHNQLIEDATRNKESADFYRKANALNENRYVTQWY